MDQGDTTRGPETGAPGPEPGFWPPVGPNTTWDTVTSPTRPEPVPPEPSDAAGAPDTPPSWAWSAPSDRLPGDRNDPAFAPLVTEPETPKRGGGMRSAFVGGIAGALVGALIAGGLVVAFDDDPEPQPTRSVTQETADSVRPAAQVAEPGNIRSILDAARPAVVRIDVGDIRSGASGTGTGFIVDETGFIVTNAHVVSGFDSVTVHLADGDTLEGAVVGADAALDLAVVKVERTGLPTLALGDSDSLQVGDAVVAIGNALGLSEGSGATVTTGIVSGLDRVVDVGSEVLFNAVQTDAAINPGNSGGPLVDMNGQVIGINTAIASPETANNVGFAISISAAKPVIEALRTGQTPQVAFLGVTTEPITEEVSEALDVSRGALVAQVSADSAAATGGIEQGDVIVEIAGVEVDSVDDVASEVRKHAPGDQIDVVVIREAGERQTLAVTLGDRPDNS